MLIQNSYSSSAADTAAYANDIQPIAATAVTLLATVPGDGLAHKVIVSNNTSTDYSSAKTFALVGTAFDGSALTETLAGPGVSTTSTSTNYFKTLTSVTPSFTRSSTDSMDIGFTAATLTPPIWTRLEQLRGAFALGISADATGTPAYTLQQSYGGEWFNHATMASKTGSDQASILFPVVALRVIFTAASVIKLNVVMA